MNCKVCDTSSAVASLVSVEVKTVGSSALSLEIIILSQVGGRVSY